MYVHYTDIWEYTTTLMLCNVTFMLMHVIPCIVDDMNDL